VHDGARKSRGNTAHAGSSADEDEDADADANADDDQISSIENAKTVGVAMGV
jgi:hypothetical protein